MIIRNYKELSRLHTYEERYQYLKLAGKVGQETFGIDRYLNQRFYTSYEWRQVRRYVIARDHGCDLGLEDLEIHDKIYIHHMNPILLEDILEGNIDILNPEFLICTTYNTHLAIHFGDERLLTSKPIERKPFDTCPWKRGA